MGKWLRDFIKAVACQTCRFGRLGSHVHLFRCLNGFAAPVVRGAFCCSLHCMRIELIRLAMVVAAVVSLGAHALRLRPSAGFLRSAAKTPSLLPCRFNFGRLFSQVSQRTDHSHPGRPPRVFRAVPFQYHEVVDFVVEDLTNLGLGVGRVNVDGKNWVVMVPEVIVGERVKARIFANHDSYSEADLVEVVEASPERIKPPCPFFGKCGGCQYQHMPVSLQRQWKRKQVANVLQRIGGFSLSERDVLPTIGSEHVFGYRTKITPQHSPLQPDRVPTIGFLWRNSSTIVDIPKCMIASDNLNSFYAQDRLSIVHKATQTTKRSKLRNMLLYREGDHGEVVSDPRKEIPITVKGITFQIRAQDFFQNNPYVLPLLIDHVIAQTVGAGECEVLIDTYCGSGLFALQAASHFRRVFGIEVSKTAVLSAQANAQRNHISNVQFVSGTAHEIFRRVQDVDANKTVVVIDPPRKGCDEDFLQQLFRFQPRRLVYISCDPATQARDAKMIAAQGYRMHCVQPFDLFPQTRHIENVITFTREP